MRREELQDYEPSATTHAGLWLDKFLSYVDKNNQPLMPQDYANADSITKNDPEAPVRLLSEVTRLGQPALYKQFYDRWQQSLQKRADMLLGDAVADGRLIVGLGGASPHETSITLHRTYGVPVIPGSALKGLAVHYAHELNDPDWQYGGKAHKIAFGTTEAAGYLTFFDALYIPDTGFKQQALWPDILTPHHQEYTRNEAAPTDSDSPTPIQFLSASGSFLIALAGPPLWSKAVFDLLAAALKHRGIGAKTSSGYGRLHLTQRFNAQQQAQAQQAEQAADIINRVNKIKGQDVRNNIKRYVDLWQQVNFPQPYKKQVAQVILDKIAEATYRNVEDNDWYQALAEAANT